MGIINFVNAFRKQNIYLLPVSDSPVQVMDYDSKRLYQTQANLKAVIDFRAESIAQLPLKVYKRDSDNVRIRDRESEAAKLIRNPNRYQTAFEFWNGIVKEYDLFGRCYIWVFRSDSLSGWEMYIIPQEWVIGSIGKNAYGPESIRICTRNGGMAVNIPSSEFVQFSSYSPGNPGGFLSPLSALKQTLNEQINANNFRNELWKSSGRLNAQIIRPKDVQPWDEGARKRFIETFRSAWGSGGSKAGSIPLLEDGMEIKPFSTSFKEQQWVESVQLSREEVAAAFRMNPKIIWNSGTQTYASAKDNARALYAECLGPTIMMLQQRVNSFLFPLIGADSSLYAEFDLNEKLKASFEERADIMMRAAGAPWLTRNEVRAEENRPPIDGGDEIITPLNVLIGGQASVADTHSHQEGYAGLNFSRPRLKKIDEIVRIKSAPTSEEEKTLLEILEKFFERQEKSILPKLSAGIENWFKFDRWDKELSEDLYKQFQIIADRSGKNAAEELGTRYLTEITVNYLKKLSQSRAHAINSKTYKRLTEVLTTLDVEQENVEVDMNDLERPKDVFEKRKSKDAVMLGTTLSTQIASWSTLEAAQQAVNSGFTGTVMKEWVTGPNARETHSIMNGQRVSINGFFSNGAKWPADESLIPDESCGCNCSVDVVIM